MPVSEPCSCVFFLAVRMQAVLRRWREKLSEVREERLSVEKACRYHCHILLKKSLRAWMLNNYQHKHYQVPIFTTLY